MKDKRLNKLKSEEGSYLQKSDSELRSESSISISPKRSSLKAMRSLEVLDEMSPKRSRHDVDLGDTSSILTDPSMQDYN